MNNQQLFKNTLKINKPVYGFKSCVKQKVNKIFVLESYYRDFKDKVDNKFNKSYLVSVF